MQTSSNGDGAAPATTMKMSFKGFKIAAQPKKDAPVASKPSTFAAAKDDEESESRKRNIVCFEDGVAKVNEPANKKKKDEYKITIERRHDWRIERLKKLVEDGTATKEDLARLELMLEAVGGEESKKVDDSGEVIQQARDANKDGSIVEADYNVIPHGQFGLAYLRGCGWHEGDGIGVTNKQVVKLRVTEARPKGLGLGTTLTLPSSHKSEKDGGKSRLKPRAYVKIKEGIYKHCRGEVQSLDEDNSSCFVKLEDGGGVVRVSEFSVDVVERKSKKK